MRKEKQQKKSLAAGLGEVRDSPWRGSCSPVLFLLLFLSPYNSSSESVCFFLRFTTFLVHCTVGTSPRHGPIS